MLFHSIEFLVFFPVVVLLYAFLPRKCRALWLLIASYYFYMSWNAKYAILIAVSTLVTWAGSLLIGRIPKDAAAESPDSGQSIPGVRRAVLILVFVVNLGILFFFKYFDFAIQSVNRAIGLIGISPVRASFDVLLPVGISFYTFQALGYCVDVYRGEEKAEKSLLRYALFVSFFPQLVAGPIERSGHLMRQIDGIEEIRVRDAERIVNGLILMLWGLFLKMVVADRVAIVADTVFKRPYLYGTCGLITGAIAFSLQIYCDFNAYSTIARGAARVMGFDLMDNFDTPYFAQSIADFWRRWHISLTSWFRDYVYIPLGGNRCSRGRRYLNQMITFLVSGLWHGAAWTYVAWGGLHGIYRIVGDLLKKPLTRIGDLMHVDRTAFSYRFGRIILTDILVVFAWILFRAESLTAAGYYIGRMFTRPDPWTLFDGSLYRLGLEPFEAHVLMIMLLLLFLIDLIKYRRNEELPALLARQNLWFRWAVLIGMILMILVYGAYGVDFHSEQFLYFTF